MSQAPSLMTFVDRPITQVQPAGFHLYPGFLDSAAQARLRDEVLGAVAAAPFHRPVTPGGGRMSVAMTGMGTLGWTSDAKGYRYEPRHPLTGEAWPAIPQRLLDIWAALAGTEVAPDSCLVNLYAPGARMGLHQDRDEADLTVPVLSVSLGATAVFRLGGRTRRGPTRSVRLASGDVCVLAGPARLAFHGVDRIIPGSSRLLAGGGRLNLTLRRAAPAAGVYLDRKPCEEPAHDQPDSEAPRRIDARGFPHDPARRRGDLLRGLRGGGCLGRGPAHPYR